MIAGGLLVLAGIVAASFRSAGEPGEPGEPGRADVTPRSA
jgi:hypothetical protein